MASVGIAKTFTSEQLRDMFEVNFFGVQRLLRAAPSGMRKNRSGLVINIGSIVGRLTIPVFGLYGASKFAIEALTESYRCEVSRFGVDVVLVQPRSFLHEPLLWATSARGGESYGDIFKLLETSVRSSEPTSPATIRLSRMRWRRSSPTS
jgi:NAD(P)-dependent dehydrogenase (short-subunit alcohol dehydrogenase family)